MTDPLVIEHLRALCARQKAAVIARAIGVSHTAISLVLSGKREASPDFLGRLTSQFPLPAAPPPQAERKGESKQNPESVWLNVDKARTTDLCRAAEDAKDSRDEVDRLVSSVEYQTVRSRLLLAAAGRGLSLEDVLMAPPESGPTVAMRAAIAQVRESIAESAKRQETIDPSKSSELYRAHSSHREALRRKLERLEAGDDVGALVKTGAWRATVTALCAVYQPLADDRVRALESLRGLDSNGFAVDLRAALEGIRAITFPCTQYQDDPVGFCRDILGLELWDGQIRILEGARDHKWVVVHTGHKVGKTKCLAALCLWRYCCWPRGRVIISNSTGDQLERQDWPEIRETHAESGICLRCRKAGVTVRPCPHSQVIDGHPGKSSKSGLESPDGKRWIFGSTAKKSDHAGGYSGSDLAIVADEFSSMPQPLYEGWIGNTAAEGTIFIGVGNPIGHSGPMFDAVKKPSVRKHFHIINISTEETVDVGIPGLGGRKYIEFVRDQDERGEKSPFYMVRVKGLYPELDTRAIFPFDRILEAQDAHNYSNTPAVGRLVISIDPSGESGLGDDAGVAVFRGQKWIEKKLGRGWSYEYYLDLVVDLIERHGAEGERAIIAIDADGVGQKVMTRLDNYLISDRIPAHEKVRFEVVPIYTGQNAPNQFLYDLVRDEAFAVASRWLVNGGVFEADPKLEQELQLATWTGVIRNRPPRGKVELMSATRKDGENGYRQVLHRSPTRLDLLILFAYASFRRDVLVVPSEDSPQAVEDEERQFSAVRTDPRRAMSDYIRALRRGKVG